MTAPVGSLVTQDGYEEGGGTVTVVSTAANPVVTNISDPSTLNKANVLQFHNADNQALGGSTYGVNTGGVAQLLNQAGNLDRQREVGQDNVAAVGIAAGGANFAMQFKTTSTGNLASGTQTYTPAAMSGTIGGVAWKIQTGSVLLIDTVASGVQETVTVTSTASTTFTAVFANAHNGSVTAFPIVGFTYNQERDAAGENDSAAGTGTAVAAEYEYNGGDAAGGNFDRARNVQGKAKQTATISSGGTQGSTSLTLSVGPPASGVGSLQPGAKVLLSTGNNPTTSTFECGQVALNYVPGSTTVPLASATINAATYTKLLWDGFSHTGPLAGATVTPFGMGAETVFLIDPITGWQVQAAMNPGSSGAMQVSSDGNKNTYRFAVQAFAPVATPTAFFQIAGSSTATLRVKWIRISGVATAAGNMQVQLSRWSTAGTLGSAALTTINPVKHDTQDANFSGTVSTVGTANYTTQGTGNNVLAGAGRIEFSAAGTGLVINPLVWDFASRQDKAFVLRGTTDILSLSGNGSAIPSGGVVDIECEVETDNS